MFESRFNKEGILNEKTGLDYRKLILERGGSMVRKPIYIPNFSLNLDLFCVYLKKKDATDMVKDFLGREPNEEAFLKSKGV